MTRLRSITPLVFLLPLSIDSQDTANVQALTLLAKNAGTCFAHTVQNANGRTNAVNRSALVVKTVTPSGSREISIFRDKAGNVVGYAEISSVFIPPFASENDNIVASYRPDGRVSGTWTHLTIQMSDSGVTKLDTASLRKMRERAVRRSSQKPLDTADQQQVRTLIKWVSRRCPA
jgi:hypothetical protein